jgi:hypothetical protein
MLGVVPPLDAIGLVPPTLVTLPLNVVQSVELKNPFVLPFACDIEIFGVVPPLDAIGLVPPTDVTPPPPPPEVLPPKKPD